MCSHLDETRVGKQDDLGLHRRLAAGRVGRCLTRSAA
jgi:hypothetical protein